MDAQLQHTIRTGVIALVLLCSGALWAFGPEHTRGESMTLAIAMGAALLDALHVRKTQTLARKDAS